MENEKQTALQASPNQDGSVETFIVKAIEQNLPVETMERLFALREKYLAARAKEEFDAAMADFQGECPVIVKSKEGGKTRGGQVAYKYAPLDVIVSQVKELLKKHGFSYAIKTEIHEEKVKAICIVKHRAGHSESSDLEVPLGAKTEIMSAPQVVAAAATFAKRYAFCNAFGILTGDEDNDAESVGKMSPKAEVFTATADAYQEQKAKLQAVKSMDELKKVWASLPAGAKVACATVKDELKAKLSNEKS